VLLPKIGYQQNESTIKLDFLNIIMPKHIWEFVLLTSTWYGRNIALATFPEMPAPI
jgi:hypothetical protein